MKKTIYIVKTAVDGSGGRFSDKAEAERARDALKRSGHKQVRIVTRVVR